MLSTLRIIRDLETTMEYKGRERMVHFDHCQDLFAQAEESVDTARIILKWVESAIKSIRPVDEVLSESERPLRASARFNILSQTNEILEANGAGIHPRDNYLSTIHKFNQNQQEISKLTKLFVSRVDREIVKPLQKIIEQETHEIETEREALEDEYLGLLNMHVAHEFDDSDDEEDEDLVWTRNKFDNQYDRILDLCHGLKDAKDDYVNFIHRFSKAQADYHKLVNYIYNRQADDNKMIDKSIQTSPTEEQPTTSPNATSPKPSTSRSEPSVEYDSSGSSVLIPHRCAEFRGFDSQEVDSGISTPSSRGNRKISCEANVGEALIVDEAAELNNNLNVCLAVIQSGANNTYSDEGVVTVETITKKKKKKKRNKNQTQIQSGDPTNTTCPTCGSAPPQPPPVELKRAIRPWILEFDQFKPKIWAGIQFRLAEFRKVALGRLNRLNSENCAHYTAFFRSLNLDKPKQMQCLRTLIYQRASKEPGYSKECALICKAICSSYPQFFNWNIARGASPLLYSGMNILTRQAEICSESNSARRQQLNKRLHEDIRLREKRYLAGIKFMGHLYLEGVLPENNISVYLANCRASNFELEALCTLVDVIGLKISSAKGLAKGYFDDSLRALRELAKSNEMAERFFLDPRVRCRIQDTVDLSENSWTMPESRSTRNNITLEVI